MSQSTSAERNGKELAQGITGISVRGYKSLYEECSIEIRPLTILAGANSSGKSSIMQPLLLMKQTLEAVYEPAGALLLNGSNIRFTLVEQFLSKFPGESRSNSLTVKIEIINREKVSVINTFQKPINRKNEFQLIETLYQSKEEETRLSPQMSHEEIVPILPRRYKNYYEGASEIRRQWRWGVSRIRCFLDLNLDEKLNPGFLASPFEEQIRKLIHIPGVRGNRERNYPTTTVGSEFPGTFDYYVASVINHWKNTEDNRIRELESALKALGLTGKVDARQVNDVQIELRVSRLRESEDGSDMVSLADVGIGVSQVLPVLVAILVAEPGQSVYLEQPEIHLHPRAQVAMAQILADAAKRDVRVILETHSELLLLAVQSLVAEGKLSPDLVKLHWFTRREDGVTEVSSAELDEAGAFGDWPEDFGDVSMKLESRYLDAAESRLWKRSHGG